MPPNKTRRLAEAADDLERCLEAYKPSTAKERSISFIALTKAFEVSLEYAWKLLKNEVEERGLEANSPKDAVREAAQIDYIAKPEIWIDAINARNQSVHDYFSMTEQDFVGLIRNFGKELKALRTKAEK